jgi:hypothetical protein
MDNIADDDLLTGVIMGLLPKSAAASSFVQSVIGANIKMGNGRPDPTLFTYPESKCRHSCLGPSGSGGKSVGVESTATLRERL